MTTQKQLYRLRKINRKLKPKTDVDRSIMITSKLLKLIRYYLNSNE